MSRVNAAGALDDNGERGRVLVNYSATTTNLPNNVITRAVRYRQATPTVGGWTTVTGQFNSASPFLFPVGIVLSLDRTYDIEVSVKDSLDTTGVTRVTTMSSAFATIDFKVGGTGVAFGKVAAMENTLETEFHLRANNRISSTRGYDGQRLTPYEDLNNYKNPGFWYSPSNAEMAATPNSPPMNRAGSLEVLPTNGENALIQLWHEYDTAVNSSGSTWRRRYYGGSWSPWTRPGDTQWQTFTSVASGYTGALRVRGKDGVTYLKGRVTRTAGNFPAGWNVIGTIPTWAAPPELYYSFGADQAGRMQVVALYANGNIGINPGSTGYLTSTFELTSIPPFINSDL